MGGAGRCVGGGRVKEGMGHEAGGAVASGLPRALLALADPRLAGRLRRLIEAGRHFSCVACPEAGAEDLARDMVPALVVLGAGAGSGGGNAGANGAHVAEAGARVAAIRRLLPDSCILAVIEAPGAPGLLPTLLRAGADDVIGAPLVLEEFDARLRRRMGLAWVEEPLAAAVSLVPGGEGLILPGRQEGEPVRFTPFEVDILRELTRGCGAIVSRNQLSRSIDGADWEYGDRKFDVHVAKIRRKLAAAFGDQYVVRSVRAEGYVLSAS